MSRVRWPLRARLVARWLAREVFPSPPTALVIITTRCEGHAAAIGCGAHDRQCADDVQSEVGGNFVCGIDLLALQFEESNSEKAAEKRAKKRQPDDRKSLFFVLGARRNGILDGPDS